MRQVFLKFRAAQLSFPGVKVVEQHLTRRYLEQRAQGQELRREVKRSQFLREGLSRLR